MHSWTTSLQRREQDDASPQSDQPLPADANLTFQSMDCDANTHRNNEFRKRCLPRGFDLNFLGLTTERNRIQKLKLKNTPASSNASNLSKETDEVSQTLRRYTTWLHRMRTTKYDVILLVLNILMSTSLIVLVSVLEKVPRRSANPDEEILTLKFMNVSGGPGGEGPMDDALTAKLTFQDRIKMVKASQSLDLDGQVTLNHLTFHYSQGKQGNIYGSTDCGSSCTKLDPLRLAGDERIDQVIIYEDYRRIDNMYRMNKKTYLVVGIYLRTTAGQERSYGMMQGRKRAFNQEGYFLGYSQGKGKGYIDSLRLIFYKYCLKNSPSSICIN